jgi:hypothetical protein
MSIHPLPRPPRDVSNTVVILLVASIFIPIVGLRIALYLMGG